MQEPNQNKVTGDNLKNGDYLSKVIDRCQKGEVSAMEIIYDAYKKPLYNFCYRFCGNHTISEDLLQDIFLNIFKSISSLRSHEAFHTWAYRTAINTCMDYSRKKERLKEVPLGEMEHIQSGQKNENPLKEYIKQAVTNLPLKQKSIFIFHDIMGFTHKEIAKTLKMNEGTSKSQLFKARMKIREYIRNMAT